MDNDFWLKAATTFMVGVDAGPHGSVYIQRCSQLDGTFQWEVCSGDFNLNKRLEWEVFRMPSNRDDGYRDRCRFVTKEEALKAYRKWQEADAEEREVRAGFLALSEASWARTREEGDRSV